MKIEHIAVYVKDLEKARKFYIKYFGAVSNEMYHNIINNYQLTMNNYGRADRL